VGLYSWLCGNRNVHGEEVVEFLEYLRRKVPGEWTVVWDGNNIHSRSKVVKAWLASHPNVVVEDYPSYDPQNNPDEWVWGWAKDGKRCSLCSADLEELFEYVLDALEELEHQPSLPASFVLEAGVSLSL
jgi:DDE superfamily endonuclease